MFVEDWRKLGYESEDRDGRQFLFNDHGGKTKSKKDIDSDSAKGSSELHDFLTLFNIHIFNILRQVRLVYIF